MARKASGADQLEAAKVLLKKAKTVDELRIAQAIALPLMFGLSMKQTAAAIGRSVGVTCTMRNQSVQTLSVEKKVARSKRELRNRANATVDSEAQILDEVMTQAAKDGVATVPPLKPMVEAKLGKPIALTTLYLMLKRHGWCKVPPDKSHNKTDRKGQAQWKKLPKRLVAKSYDGLT